MKLTARVLLPNGIPAGETFETNAVLGRILLLAGVVEPAPDEPSDTDPPKRKRTYRRRDLRAEE